MIHGSGAEECSPTSTAYFGTLLPERLARFALHQPITVDGVGHLLAAPRYSLLLRLLCARQKLHFPGKGDPATTAVLEEDAGESGGGFLSRPVTLPFSGDRQPCDRHRPGLDHASHGQVVGLRADATRGVGDNEDVIAFTERLNRWHREADLCPECGENELLATALLHGIGDLRILPGIDEGAVDRLLIGENVLKPFDEIAAAFFDHRGEDRWDIEYLRGFGKANDIVDDHCRLVAVQVGELIGLMVDQHEDAVFGAEEGIEAGLVAIHNRVSFRAGWL